MTKNRKWLSTSFFWLLTLLIIVLTIVFVFQLRTSVTIVNIALPFLFFAGWLFLLLRQAQDSSNQVISFGKRHTRLFLSHKQSVTLTDIAGVEETKMEILLIFSSPEHEPLQRAAWPDDVPDLAR